MGGGSAGSVGGASVGLGSTSAPSISALGAPAFSSNYSMSQSDSFNIAQGVSSYFQQGANSSKSWQELKNNLDNIVDKVSGPSYDKGQNDKKIAAATDRAMKQNDKTGSYGQKRKPGDYLK